MYEKSDGRTKENDIIIGFLMEEYDEHIELFENYIGGEMTAKEVLDFEARLAYDSTFREVFNRYQAIEIAIKTHFRDELKSKFEDVDREMDQAHFGKLRSNKRRMYYTTVAAVMAVAVFVFIRFQQLSGSEELVAQYWPDEPGLPVKMSAKGKYDDAMNAFKLKEYKTAEKILSHIPTDTANYFLGVVAYKQSDFRKSANYFKRVDLSSAYYYEAQFRLALVYLLTENVKESHLILKKQINDSTEFSSVSNAILEGI